MPRASVSPTQSHFAALSRGGGTPGAAMSLRGGVAGAGLGRGASTQSAEELAASRAARKEASKVRKEAKSAETKDKPLSTERSWAAHADAVIAEEGRKDLAERTLSRLPGHMPRKIADGKIYKYVYDATHKDGASKAAALEALGHKIQPGDFDPPIPEDVRRNGEGLKKQIIKSTATSTAVLREQEAHLVAKQGVKFTTTAPIPGIGVKSGKSSDLLTAWIDKRQQDGEGSGVLELATLIPQGDKK